ncbi:MAG: hypothetical protein WBM57_06475 [Woeseiaceae bacterium]
MSSTAYFAEIRPDALLRRFVLASGLALALGGLLLILILPVPLEIRVVGSIGWLAVAASELARARLAWNSCHAMRFFADGTIDVLIPGQIWQPAHLLSGGVLLRQLGWIRLGVTLSTGHKLVLGEFLRGNGRESADWRRLQVIWRHIGA